MRSPANMGIKVLACRHPASELRWVLRAPAAPSPIRTRFQVPKLRPCSHPNLGETSLLRECIRADLVLSGGFVVMNLPANTEDAGSILRLGKPPGGGNVNPRHYFCLENSMDTGALGATVHGVTRRPTHTHTHAWWVSQYLRVDG